MLIFMTDAFIHIGGQLQRPPIGKIAQTHRAAVEQVVILQQDMSKDIIMEVLEPVEQLVSPERSK